MEAHLHVGLPRAPGVTAPLFAYLLTPPLTSHRGLLLLEEDEGCGKQHLISSWLRLSLQWASSEEHVPLLT